MYTLLTERSRLNRALQSILIVLLAVIPGQGLAQGWKLLSRQSGELPDAAIIRLLEATDGTLFVQTRLGLRWIKDGQLADLPPRISAAAATGLTDLFQTEDGAIWIATQQNGAFLFSRGQVNELRLGAPDAPLNGVKLISKQGDFVLLIDKSARILVYNTRAGHWASHPQQISLDKDESLSVVRFASESKMVVAATSHSRLLVFPFREGELEPGKVLDIAEGVTDPEERSFRMAVDLVQLRSGAVAIITSGQGVFLLTADRVLRPLPNLSRKKLTPTGLYESSRGALWITTNNEGLYLIRNQAELHFGKANGTLPSDEIEAFHLTADGSALIAVKDSGIFRVEEAGGILSPSQEKGALPERSVRGFYETKKDVFAVGTQGSVWRLIRDNTWGIERPSIGAFSAGGIGSDGSLWVATISGLRRHSLGQWFDHRDPPVFSLRLSSFWPLKDGRAAFSAFGYGLLLYAPRQAKLEFVRVEGDTHQALFRIHSADETPRTWTLHYSVTPTPDAAGEDPIASERRFEQDGTVAVSTDKRDGRFRLSFYSLSDGGDVAQGGGTEELIVSSSWLQRVWKFSEGAAPFLAPAHVLIWAVLFALYPVSATVQALFFWNDKVRSIAGLWYIDFLLTLPGFRSWMLRPFRAELVSEVQRVESFRFYEGLTLREAGEGRDNFTGPITKAVKRLQGHVVIRGRSGSGKTYLLRWLVGRHVGLCTVLTATTCDDGVVEAIARLLPEYLTKNKLLERLIYVGALAVYIDGLNEAKPEGRAAVSAALRRFPRSTIIITTQAIAWRPPTTVRTLDVQSLTEQQILDYMRLKMNGVPEADSMLDRFMSEYIRSEPDTCGELRDPKRPILGVLSNPFDLDLAVAIMIRGQLPTMLNLVEEFFSSVIDEAGETLGAAMPIELISSRAYDARLQSSKELNDQDIPSEVTQLLLDRRILLPKRSINSFSQFRHEKLQDYLILRHLAGSSELQEQHLSDIRFTGVYALLADALPRSKAAALHGRLAIVAAETKEHTIVDAFVTKLHERGLI